MNTYFSICVDIVSSKPPKYKIFFLILCFSYTDRFDLLTSFNDACRFIFAWSVLFAWCVYLLGVYYLLDVYICLVIFAKRYNLQLNKYGWLLWKKMISYRSIFCGHSHTLCIWLNVMETSILFFTYDLITELNRDISWIFCRNSEAYASEFLQNIQDMFPRFMNNDVIVLEYSQICTHCKNVEDSL